MKNKNIKLQNTEKKTYKRKQQELYMYTYIYINILVIRDEGWTANSNDVYKKKMIMKSLNQ